MKITKIENGIDIVAESPSEYDILEGFWHHGVDIVGISAKSKTLKILDKKVK